MKKIFFVIAAFLVSLSATMAFAGDIKVYPGSMAVRWNASQPVPYLDASFALNPATIPLRVDLPVIRDGGSIANGWVQVLDRHYTDNVCATLVTIYRSGCTNYGWVSPRKCSTGTTCAAQTLNFGFLNANYFAHSYYSCYIPAVYSGQKSGIISYQVNEN